MTQYCLYEVVGSTFTLHGIADTIGEVMTRGTWLVHARAIDKDYLYDDALSVATGGWRIQGEHEWALVIPAGFEYMADRQYIILDVPLELREQTNWPQPYFRGVPA